MTSVNCTRMYTENANYHTILLSILLLAHITNLVSATTYGTPIISKLNIRSNVFNTGSADGVRIPTLNYFRSIFMFDVFAISVDVFCLFNLGLAINGFVSQSISVHGLF